MSCEIPVLEGVKEAADCKCYPAVMSAYGGMLVSGVPQSVALEAALRVYRYHHPDDGVEQSMVTVERWTTAQNIH